MMSSCTQNHFHSCPVNSQYPQRIPSPLPVECNQRFYRTWQGQEIVKYDTLLNNVLMIVMVIQQFSNLREMQTVSRLDGKQLLFTAAEGMKK